MLVIRCGGALLYDALLLLSLYLSFTAVCLFLRHGQSIPAGTYWYQAALLTLTYFYYAKSYKKGGQTIGMRAWRLKLVSDEVLTHQRILKRFILFIPAWMYGVVRMKSPYDLLKEWTKTQIIKLNLPHH